MCNHDFIRYFIRQLQNVMLIALINFVSKKLVTIYESQGNHTEKSKAAPLHAMVALGGRGNIAPTQS
jgi:hypothetical protein